MSKQTAVVDVSAFTTDAKFRTWGLAASTAIQATGLVKTSDIGQINWATVTKPITTATKAGYEVYRFDDALQATRPIFIRVDYGSAGTTTGNSPSTWITIGTGTDGAGTITGLAVGPLQSGYSGTNAPANTAMTMNFAYNSTEGYLFWCFGMGLILTSGTGSFTSPGFYIVERTKDAAGASTGSGVRLLSTNYGTAHLLYDRGINFDTGAVFGTSRFAHCGALSNNVSLSTANSVAVYRHYAGLGAPYPVIGAVSFYSGDAPNESAFTATPHGSTPHDYFVWTQMSGADYNGNSSIVLAYMWED